MSTQFSQTVFSPWLTPVRVVSTSNIVGVYSNGPSNNGVGATLTVTPPLVVDSVLCNVGDRVLLAGQTSSFENGVYIVASSEVNVVLQRAADQQNLEQIQVGQYISVAAGAVYAGTFYTVVEPKPLQLGVSSVVWNQVVASGGGGSGTVNPGLTGQVGQYSANGTVVAGATLVAGSGVGIVNNPGSITISATGGGSGTVNPGLALQVAQYDSNGTVVAGANLAVNSPLTVSTVLGSYTLGSTVGGNLYVNGFRLQHAGNTVLNLMPGSARDSSNSRDITMVGNVPVNASNVGVVNGLDTGVFANNSCYAVYVIADSNNVNPTGGLFSLNLITPSLPVGYDLYRRVGYGLTNPATQFTLFYQTGNGDERTYYNPTSPLQSLNAGGANAWADVAINSGEVVVPPVDGLEAYFYLEGSFAAAGFALASIDNWDIVVPPLFNAAYAFGFNVTGIMALQAWCPYSLDAGVPKVRYYVRNAGDTLTIQGAGFKDYL